MVKVGKLLAIVGIQMLERNNIISVGNASHGSRFYCSCDLFRAPFFYCNLDACENSEILYHARAL